MAEICGVINEFNFLSAMLLIVSTALPKVLTSINFKFQNLFGAIRPPAA